jgi:intein/homing endonuclease
MTQTSSYYVKSRSAPVLDIRPEDRFVTAPSFIAKFVGKEPEWGPVGLITYKRTYARPLPDGSTEDYWQTLERIVNGIYTVQKWHCHRHNLPWSDSKAQRSAQTMFQLMWDFKFLPGGRGLWMMGTNYVEERGSAALNNCFVGAERLITKHGVLSFTEANGRTVEVLTREGWAEAEVKSFGTQKVQRVTFAPAMPHPKSGWRAMRSNLRHTLTATPNHRWILADGGETTTLKVGDFVPAQMNKDSEQNAAYNSGFRHGMVFADGTAGYKHIGGNSRAYHVRLCGDKKKHAELFQNVTYPESYNGDAYAHIISDFDLKSPPDSNWSASPDHVRGFIDGWLAGDGSLKPGGSYALGTQDAVAAEWVAEHAALGGYVVTGVNTSAVMETNFGRRTAPLQSITLSKGSVAWKVVSIEPLEEEETVFCAVVPSVGSFTLANGVYTGNCSFVSTDSISTSFSEPFCFLMDFSMLGVGVGGDCKGAGKVTIQRPIISGETYVVEDTREGWVDLVHRVLESYVGKSTIPSNIDYSKIRPYGAMIKSFGGTAAGPEPLQRLVREIQRLLDRLVGFPITSEAIVDIFDMIGVCVVAGNVRRCLPGDTLIHTENGLVPIKNINVGDMVITSGLKSDRLMPVTAKLDQGAQSLVEIKTQMGPFRCTPNHRMAVFTACDTYDFKRANQLEIGDRLVFVEHGVDGSETSLPAWSYAKPAHSTTCKDITVPALDEKMAWFLGLFLGDGYTYANRAKDGFNAHISVAVGNDHTHDAIAGRVRGAIEQFGVNVNEVEPSSDDNCRKIRAQSKQLAWYFDENFKRPHESLDVPECILKGSKTARAAFLAGLLDADGSIGNRPTLLCASVYPKFLEQVQAVYASLGIPTRIKTNRAEKGNWQALYHLVLVGKDVKPRFQNTVMVYSVKSLPETGWESQFDYGYPTEWIKESLDYAAWKGKWTPANKQMTIATFKDCGGSTKGLTPIAVLDVSEVAGEHQTYDIEVAGAEEFVANGLLVHNSAIIMFGEGDDESFLNLKNPALNKDAMNGWRWASNNSIFATVGMDYTRTASITQKAGEPGFMWLENLRKFGRTDEPADDNKIGGCNPCAEIGLESYEMCNLVELFPSRHASYEEFERTIKFAYLYAKTVSLIPTHNMRTNSVMLRNRRIGLSQSGIVQSFARHGRRAHFEWCDKGYGYVTRLDKMYSEWLCVPKSIKKTTVKPAGTTSLLPGVTPGIHHEHAAYYFRTIRVAKSSPLVEQHRIAGYRVEDDIYDKASNTAVIYFPIKAQFFERGKDEVSMWEQLENTAQMQKYWSDNSVSVTVTFKKNEAKDIAGALELYENRLKTVSFLPLEDHGYEQAPYITIDAAEYEKAMSIIAAADLSKIGHDEESTPRYCDNDKCDVRPRPKSIKV